MTSDELAEIYKAYGGMVERQAMRVIRDRALAQDITHEVFVGFINYNSRGTHVHDVTGLLYQMATQYAIKKLRARGRVQVREQVEGVAESPKAHAFDAWRVFDKILAGCDDVRAQIAVHYFIDGMSQAEIGEAMKMQKRQVGRHLERFCDKARRLVKDINDKQVPSKAHTVRATR